MTEAIRLCHERMVTPGLETVQGFLLVGFYFGGEGNIRGKHVYVVQDRLHAERYFLRILRQWCFGRSVAGHGFYVAVHWSASDMAVEPPAAFHDMTPLPEIDDADLHTLNSDMLAKSRRSASSRCDMWAQVGRTLNIYTRINVLLRRLVRMQSLSRRFARKPQC